MGDSFSKKENIKKKIEKRKLKDKRRENRKTDNNKGKQLEEMMIYVDESGNLSKTPTRSQDGSFLVTGPSINHNREIQKKEKRKGTVISFFIEKGYGFIKDQKSGDHIFVHMKDLLDEISEKDQVFFVKQKTAKGAKATLVEKR
ncbi:MULTISPECIES: cold-shock protein [Zunongwangia]|uniref:Cold-shock protein n=1 Tax=Zunongwangia profunda TaxID=398743 RepID=A0A3D5J0E4_9FLAO|nr:cold shock domain-containing protein [Zunongwangia profunda]HCV80750.1 cold-shock protein [Zunongwangia profunda]|tara:strand:+ start:206 stop:637 length:432 start_codon:yes stop_codon:yes gene_type:complete